MASGLPPIYIQRPHLRPQKARSPAPLSSQAHRFAGYTSVYLADTLYAWVTEKEAYSSRRPTLSLSPSPCPFPLGSWLSVLQKYKYERKQELKNLHDKNGRAGKKGKGCSAKYNKLANSGKPKLNG